MNFIWDIVLNAKSHGTEEEELFFRPAKESSPWYEQSFPILNEDRAEGPEIEYNPLYRFDALFHDLMREDLDESPEFQAQLFDAVSHLLVQTDCTMAYPSESTISTGCFKNWRKVDMVQQ